MRGWRASSRRSRPGGDPVGWRAYGDAAWQGRGGPNQEYALALALALDDATGICALAGDTDGTDGGGGEPEDPAGAFIDATTLAPRAAAASIQPCF